MKTYHEIKFKHNIHKSGWKHTLAFIQPDAKKLLKQYKLALDKLETPKVPFWYGLSLCHRDDQFNRKTGRTLSEPKVDRHEMDLFAFINYKDSYEIRLRGIYKNRFEVEIGLYLYKDTGKIRVLESTVYEV